MRSSYQYNQYILAPKVGPAAWWWSCPCDIVLWSLVTRWQQGEQQLASLWLAEDSSEDGQCSLIHHHPPWRPLILVQNERKVQKGMLEEVQQSLLVVWSFMALAGLLGAADLVTREACGPQDRG